MILLFLMALAFAFWTILVPILIWEFFPTEVRYYLMHGAQDGSDTLLLLVLFLGIPLAFGISAVLAILTCIVISKPFATRTQVEAFLRSGIFGGQIGPLEKFVFDAVFGKESE